MHKKLLRFIDQRAEMTFRNEMNERKDEKICSFCCGFIIVIDSFQNIDFNRTT